jgi:hypothetical protein
VTEDPVFGAQLRHFAGLRAFGVARTITDAGLVDLKDTPRLEDLYR